jgi:hypothetical protein
MAGRMTATSRYGFPIKLRMIAKRGLVGSLQN